MKHKISLVLLMGLVTMTLTGCHITHEWQEATCTTPRTCLKGGETEGEPLGHTWAEATCTEPKTCTVCGETEGEALGHTWLEATCTEPETCSICGETQGEASGHTLSKPNYQQAAVCQICGESVGEPLAADFEKNGFTNMAEAELDVAYPYETICYDDPEYTTVGTVTFSDYEVFTSDDEHEAVDGCEWRAVTITFRFDDENVNEYGYMTDYYNCDYFNLAYDYEINYNGTAYPDCGFHSQHQISKDWKGNVATSIARKCALVPIGYDGCVIIPYNSKNRDLGNNNKAPNSEKIEAFMEGENTVYFRMK